MSELIQWEILDLDRDVADIFELFMEEPYAFLLDSSLQDRQRGRFSFIGFAPFKIIQGNEEKDLSLLKKAWGVYQIKDKGRATYPSPFPAGLMGFLSYDFGRGFEHISSRHYKEHGSLPGCFFGFYDAIITVDHVLNKIYISSCGFPETSSHLRKAKAKEKSKQIQEKILQAPAGRRGRSKIGAGASSAQNRKEKISSNFTRSEYYKTIRKALDYIRRGEIYQVNLAQRFCFDGAGRISSATTFRLYRLLRELSPSSFGAFWNGGELQIISSSPERFLSLRGDRVETRPMKGTRPRGATGSRDRQNQRDLDRSRKDIAELLMITDLERNDLGRVCRPGSVRVREMRTLEKYNTVFQATATIEGKMQSGKDAFDLLKACFPGGSITGCPKIRSMQIIDELEPSSRGVYTGSLGYLSFSGNMDFNVLIRTLTVLDRKIFFHVGGGIVADSTPEKEYEETLVKAKAMRMCLERMFGNGRKK